MLLSKIHDIASGKPNRWFCALQLIDNSYGPSSWVIRICFSLDD